MANFAYDVIFVATFIVGAMVGWVIAMDDMNGPNDSWRWRWKK